MGLFFKNTIVLVVVPPKFCIGTILMQNFGGTSKSIMIFLKKAYWVLSYNDS